MTQHDCPIFPRYSYSSICLDSNVRGASRQLLRPICYAPVLRALRVSCGPLTSLWLTPEFSLRQEIYAPQIPGAKAHHFREATIDHICRSVEISVQQMSPQHTFLAECAALLIAHACQKMVRRRVVTTAAWLREH